MRNARTGGTRPSIVRVLAAVALGLHACLVSAATDLKIVTGSERGTYNAVGRDLAAVVAPVADVKLDVLPSAGSAENVRRLRYEPGVKLALVQSDVYRALLDQAATGNAEAEGVVRPLRVILPLYNEEIHFVVRADSKLEFVDQIRDARISAGPLGSGAPLTTATLYRLMFDAPLPEANTAFMTNEDALAALTDRSVDVAVIVEGQPAKIFADMKPQARRFIRFLKFDPDHPRAARVLDAYYATALRVESYPNLLADDVPSIAVRSLLVTDDGGAPPVVRALARFAGALCESLSKLQDVGHPKWRDVQLALPDLGAGLAYYEPTAKPLRACIASRLAPPVSPSAAPSPPEAARAGCPMQQRVLGLCE